MASASSVCSQQTSSRKRKREKATMHPRNKYAENPPDFSFLASKYPTFNQYVFLTPNGKARIDWTDFNANRELTRVLLMHDFGIQWWIPDGQLCPTVPNRTNYIHWIQDLLTSCPSPWRSSVDDLTWGFDIGTGANCIYPLLGAALQGWHFIGTDVTDTALEWARWNVQQNPHLAGLISIRSVKDFEHQLDKKINEDKRDGECNLMCGGAKPLEGGVSRVATSNGEATELEASPIGNACSQEFPVQNEVILAFQRSEKTGMVQEIDGDEGSSIINENLEEVSHSGHESLPVLAGVVGDKEKFDFCMCNPPFFETMEEAGANPHTSCGGTWAEMVYPGGEEGFITRIIEDSTQLKEQMHWFTTMVGRKVNLKVLILELRKKGVRMLRTTEFVQGRTCRWGLAWSFNPPEESLLSQRVIPTNTSRMSFMLEGLPRHCRAYDVLQKLVFYVHEYGASCKVDMTTFSLKGSFQDQLEKQQKEAPQYEVVAPSTKGSSNPHFTLSVFEQAPGALLIKGMLLAEKSRLAGTFSTMLSSVEQNLKQHFVRKFKQNDC